MTVLEFAKLFWYAFRAFSPRIDALIDKFLLCKLLSNVFPFSSIDAFLNGFLIPCPIYVCCLDYFGDRIVRYSGGTKPTEDDL